MLIKRNLVAFFIVTFIISGTFLVQQCRPKESNIAYDKSPNEFIGDQACKNCHASEFNSWAGSGHFKAMMPATDSTVSGNFNDQTLAADGVRSHFFRKNGKFYINTEGENGSNQDFEIKYTFGYYPLQQYLVEFPGGRMQATRASWDVINKKWFYQYAGKKIPPHNWMHWTGNAANWNTMCASCHSTNLQKNYNPDSDSYHTTWSQ